MVYLGLELALPETVEFSPSLLLIQSQVSDDPYIALDVLKIMQFAAPCPSNTGPLPLADLLRCQIPLPLDYQRWPGNTGIAICQLDDHKPHPNRNIIRHAAVSEGGYDSHQMLAFIPPDIPTASPSQSVHVPHHPIQLHP